MLEEVLEKWVVTEDFFSNSNKKYVLTVLPMKKKLGLEVY